MGVFFAVLAPLVFAINNFFDKFFLEKHELSPATMTVFNGISGCLAGLVILGFTGLYYIQPNLLLLLLASGFLMIMCVLPYYKALFLDETSRVIPLFQFTPVFVLLMGYLFLAEKLTLYQYLGSFVIIVGSFLISMEQLDWRIFRIRPAFWYMLLSSFLYALSLILYKFGVEEIPFWHTLPYEGFGMLLGALVVYLTGDNQKNIKSEARNLRKGTYGLLAANEMIYIAARYTTYFALSLISASIVNVLLGLQPLFGLIIGIVMSLWFPRILREMIHKRTLAQKFFSILLIFVGLFLVFS